MTCQFGQNFLNHQWRPEAGRSPEPAGGITTPGCPPVVLEGLNVPAGGTTLPEPDPVGTGTLSGSVTGLFSGRLLPEGRKPEFIELPGRVGLTVGTGEG